MEAGAAPVALRLAVPAPDARSPACRPRRGVGVAPAYPLNGGLCDRSMEQ
jgi:hypothetical protein